MLRKKGVLYCFDIFPLPELGRNDDRKTLNGSNRQSSQGAWGKALQKSGCTPQEICMTDCFFALNTISTFHVHQSWISSKPRESITGNYVIHENQNNIRWPWIPWQILMGNVVARKVRSAHSLCCAPLSRSTLLTGLLNHFAYCLVGRPNKKWERQKK